MITMKHFLTLFLFAITTSLFSQQIDYNLSKGSMAEGYDVVAYFTANKAMKGNEKYQTTYNSVNFKFSSEGNLNLFLKKPEKYISQYGGWCAYAMAVAGDKVKIDPETFEIRDGRLYLFYNFGKTNTFEKWKKETPEKLRTLANNKWLNQSLKK